jgi:hypothetical protein
MKCLGPVSRDAVLDRGQGDECAIGAHLLGGWASWSWYVPEPLSERYQGVTIAFKGGAFVLGESELFQHLLHAVLDGEQPPGSSSTSSSRRSVPS